MIAFSVEDMFSSRSACAIVKSFKLLDHHAIVRVGLVSHRIEVEPTWADAGELGEAIEPAGFRPAFVSSDVSPDWLSFVPSHLIDWTPAA
jgi:copper chaperone